MMWALFQGGVEMMSGPGGGMEGTLTDNAEGGRRISHVNFNLDRERKLDRE